MELFEFKRYLGDDAPSSSNQTCLDDYLEKIKERKRKREEDKSEISGVEVFEQSDQAKDYAVPSLSKKNKLQKNKSPESTMTDYLKRIKSRKERREEKLKKLTENEDVGEEHFDIEDVSEKTKHKENYVHGEGDGMLDSERKSDKRPKKKIADKDCSNLLRSAPSGESRASHLESSASTKSKKKKKKKKKKKHKTNKEEVDDEGEEKKVENVEQEAVVKYEVLGGHSFQDKVKVKRVLPRWLAEPTVISAELSSGTGIRDVGKLNHRLFHNLEAMGVKELFPVQLAVIPYQLRNMRKAHYLWPRDLCVSAPTGSGKTLAYALPLLQAHFTLAESTLYALIVVPVQELALQVAKVLRDAAKGTNIKIGCITGGTDIESESKSLVVKRANGTYLSLVNVLVATPGRLVKHLFFTAGFTLRYLRFIVIDEADRVMEQRLTWLHLVEKQCDPSFSCTLPPVTFHNLDKYRKRPQKLLFSATLSQDPEKLLQLSLFQPKLITSVSKGSTTVDSNNKDHFFGKFTTPANLKESYSICESDKKPLLVHKLLADGWRKVLIFTKSCVEANRLLKLLSFLNPDIEMEELTSLMVLGKRQLVVAKFGRGLIDVLVCSDRMARGMDIQGVDYVILYDPPKYTKGYIHRAGRTGRAGLPGTSLTLLTQKQSVSFLDMLAKAGKTNLTLLPCDASEFDVFIPFYTEALESLKLYLTLQKSTSLDQILKEKRNKKRVNVKYKKRRS